MKILGKEQGLDSSKNVSSYKEPAVTRKNDKEISLGKAIIISIIAHPVAAGLIALLFLLGINLNLFEKPTPKVRDLEFVLVNKPEQQPINKNTKYRADRNSRAGGKHNPKRKVSDPEPVSKKSTPKKQTKAQTPKKAVSKPKPKQKPKVAKKTPMPPRPAPKKAAPKPKIAPPNSFKIPVPMSKAPKTLAPTGGPVTTAPLGATTPSSTPSPVMSSSPSLSSPSRRSYSSGYSPGSGNIGNPGPGNPNGPAGIDAIKEPDFGPYMRELQRRIKRNWDPPKGNESKRVVLMFTVGKRGTLEAIKIIKSSNIPSVDKAAIAAVELTAPFKPLPPEYRGNDIDIQFTFDYNVFGVGSSRY